MQFLSEALSKRAIVVYRNERTLCGPCYNASPVKAMWKLYIIIWYDCNIREGGGTAGGVVTLCICVLISMHRSSMVYSLSLSLSLSL